MTVVRTVAAAAATTILCLSFAVRLHAADADPSAMPTMPERGEKTTATRPPIGKVTGAGKAISGMSPDRIVRSVKNAKAGAEPELRGKTDQDVYAKISPSVVLIMTQTSLGSGVVIDKDGTILTAAHVVERAKTVGAIFKPKLEGSRVDQSDAVQATVLRIDEIADLAIIKVAALPADAKPVAVGDGAVLKVGADVHAIGHPYGENWSYTKGIVSQIRLGYTWKLKDEGIDHVADVVQTQTPINPGNSGGPLLNDAGEIVGIASFGGEGINFAIASSEIKRFMASTADRLAPAKVASAPAPAAKGSTGKCDEPVTLEVRRSKKGDATLFDLDTDCNGVQDAMLSVPDDKTKSVLLAVDTNENGKIDVIYSDRDRDAKFDVAYYDIDEDGHTDLIGYDLNENLEPGRVVLAKA